MASYTFENHTFRMVDRTDGKDIKVPSNMYPLNREAQLFTTETTDTISDAHVREIVNCIDGRMNNTYQNAEQVVRTLNVYGIPAVQYVNSTPFVRQYDILFNKWGVLLCQKEYQTNDIRRNSREWL